MPQHTGENSLGIIAGQGEGIRVADAAGQDANAHFPRLRRHNVNFFNDQWLARAPGDCSFGFDHVLSPMSVYRFGKALKSRTLK